MACLPHGNANCAILSEKGANFLMGKFVSPLWRKQAKTFTSSGKGTVILQCLHGKQEFACSEKRWNLTTTKKSDIFIRRSSSSSNSSGAEDDSSDQAKKAPFGYNRKDVLIIGVGVTVIGVGLKSGLEFAGFDSLQAGNVVQLVIVLGLTVGWISTYIFRVSNKEMTYAQQLRDYEKKVMEKRLESLTEAELEALLESVEEEKRRLTSGEQAN